MSEKTSDEWFVYIVECQDGSLYTGIAKDVCARIVQHNLGKGAKYTRGRGPVQLKTQKGPYGRSIAQSIEAQIKRLPACEKEIELRNRP